MKGLKWGPVTLALVLSVGVATHALAGYTRVNSENPDDLMNVAIFRLDNGLRVYLTENHETPRFYAEIAVRAGSKHDPADSTGLAHYLEHLLFKGTQELGTLDYVKEKVHLDKITELFEAHFNEDDAEKRREIYAQINRVSQEAAAYAIPNEIDKLYNGMGGTAMNAHTWHEETVYKVSLPSNRLDQWIAVESDRFVDPVFRLFHTELETVYEEKNRSLDNKGRVISQAVYDLMFKKHPYGQQPTLGSVEHLKRPSLVHIYDYFEAHYVPNNMMIAISGDIDIDEAIEAIDGAFSSWQKAKLPRRKKWKEKALNGVERVSVNYEGEEYVLIGFRTAPGGHKHHEALILIDMILDNAAAGLINLNLNQAQKVRQAGSYPSPYNDYGTQYLWGIPKDGQTLDEVEALLLGELERIKTGDFEDWIIDAILTDFKKNLKASLESNGSRVAAMRDAFIAYESWDHSVAQIARMGKVTKEDIVKVANHYFGDNYVVGRRLDAKQDIPSIDKPHIDPVDIDPTRQSAFASEVLSMPYSEIEPVFVNPDTDYKVEDVADGVKLYYAPNPLNDLFSMSIFVERGTREDSRLGVAARLLDKSGTQDFSPEELKQEWYKLGTNFSFSAGEVSTVVSVSGLDENFNASLVMMVDVLTAPSAEAETLEQLKGIILARREDAKKDPSTLGRALTQYHRFGADSSFLRMLPKAKLEALTVEELLGLVRDTLGYKRTITYTGSLPFEYVRDALRKQMPVTGPLRDTPPYIHTRARRADSTEIYFFHKEAAQAQVRIEFSDGLVDEKDATPRQLFNGYFAGGMSGLVFQELREARGLAYSAGARYVTGNRAEDENLMIGAIACQADKTPEALEVFIDLFDNMPESQERFDEAQASILNRYRTSKIGFRAVIGAVRSWQWLDLDVDPREERFDQVRNANMDTLMDFQKSHIRNRPKLISIVGDKARIDMDRIAKLGSVTEISLDQIFVD